MVRICGTVCRDRWRGLRSQDLQLNYREIEKPRDYEREGSRGVPGRGFECALW